MTSKLLMIRAGQSTHSYVPIYAFTGGADSSAPVGPPAFDGIGNMYVTSSGMETASETFGAVLMFPKSGAGFGEPTVVHSFYQGDGNDPSGGLTYSAVTNTLYGFTSFGGLYESGTAYTVTP